MILKGIRVIDFSQYIPGSYASYRLAELGAEVIKIEPLTGSPIRKLGKNDNEMIFSLYNHNKKSITLNLKDKRGQEIAKELIKSADIVIEGYRAGVMEKYNLNYEQIEQIKENIIFLSLTGYGQKGMLSEFGSHDLNYISLSGAMSLLVDEQGKPIMPKITFADIIGGITASEKILSALFYRERTGKGQYIDLSLMEEIFALTKTSAHYYKDTGETNLIPQLDGELISYNIYKTQDNRYVSLAALEYKYWKNFCEAVNREDWLDFHLTDNSEENIVYQELKELFLSRSLEDWSKLSMEVDCCLTPILEIEELETHPFIIEKDLIYSTNKTLEIGNHTDLILRELLNIKDEELKKLRAEKVI